jgi:hypothetical protein
VTRGNRTASRARNGEVIVISGLMQTRARGAEAGIPGVKTELVILLRAIVDEGNNMQDLIQD